MLVDILSLCLDRGYVCGAWEIAKISMVAIWISTMNRCVGGGKRSHLIWRRGVGLGNWEWIIVDNTTVWLITDRRMEVAAAIHLVLVIKELKKLQGPPLNRYRLCLLLKLSISVGGRITTFGGWNLESKYLFLNRWHLILIRKWKTRIVCWIQW